MQLPIYQRYIKHKEKFDWDVKNGGIFNRFFIKRYLETLGLEDFRTLGETKEARDKRQDLGFGTLGETKEARDKMQDFGFGVWDWRILGL
ncbi:hypothetical protein VB776_06210 [Arcicella sp. DC2W]|uniref:Uncharacterized protein n=1 Tax=Arcicella gelida TaxID=2984195 RepID=A0ABU5S1Z9_9BACT|nr:hypothetical protein [Arcicella sp. DC2W]MEA5402499.1 hypothetical protein [Arcicella sp. DC2W]